MVILTKENFKGEVYGFLGPVLVMFSTPGDPKNYEFEKLSENFPDVKFGFVDFDKERELVREFNIRRLPFYLFFLNGRLREASHNLEDLRAGKE